MSMLTVEIKGSDYHLSYDADIRISATEDGWFVVDAFEVSDETTVNGEIPGIEHVHIVAGPFDSEDPARWFSEMVKEAHSSVIRSLKTMSDRLESIISDLQDARDLTKDVRGHARHHDEDEVCIESARSLERMDRHIYLSTVDALSMKSLIDSRLGE